jgi:hypothetical protein
LDTQTLVERRVHEFYWAYDLNCATTTLRILSEVFGFDLHPQILDAAAGMHGAGRYGAQCGLVEGALMVLGILCRAHGLPDVELEEVCQDLARQFEARFGSLLCRELRPQGFRPENPPHLCEQLTCDAIVFDIAFVSRLYQLGILSDQDLRGSQIPNLGGLLSTEEATHG